MAELTVAIVAHNVADTIALAIRSVLASGDYPILLVADGCTDETATIAKTVGGDQIRIEELNPNQGVGAARARALASINTPYGMWLDADDEILPDRPEYMLDVLKSGTDFIYDGAELVDSVSEAVLKKLYTPSFIQSEGGLIRSFERNWLPILTCGFRVGAAREVGFDPDFTCVEDYDFLLRAIAGSRSICISKEIGYRYYHGGQSVSRNLTRTRANVTRALNKHSHTDLEQFVASSELSADEQACVLAGSALYRGEPNLCLKYAEHAGAAEDILPTYNMPALQYLCFVRASAYMELGRWEEARKDLAAFLELEQSADAWNNLGVALYHLGAEEQSNKAFKTALDLLPGYMDAKQNLDAEIPSSITTHPMRRQQSRSDYS